MTHLDTSRLLDVNVLQPYILRAAVDRARCSAPRDTAQDDESQWTQPQSRQELVPCQVDWFSYFRPALFEQPTALACPPRLKCKHIVDVLATIITLPQGSICKVRANLMKSQT